MYIKGNYKKMKRQHREWEKILTSEATYKRLNSKVYKHIIQIYIHIIHILYIYKKTKKFLKMVKKGNSHFGTVETSPTSIHEDVGLIPGLTQWVEDPALL